MAASPRWKVYDSEKRYQASCKEIEAAAALMGFYGDGATIRDNGAATNLIVWTEGAEGQPASESYDHVVAVAHSRVANRYLAAREAR